MPPNYLYSIILELCAVNTVAIQAHRGDHTHALFLDLVKQVDPDLSSRLHDEPEYRPFTVSVLHGAKVCNGLQLLQAGQIYRLRLTLFDGGHLWQCLSTHFLETNALTLRLDTAHLRLARVLSTPSADPTGWAGYTTWQTLAATKPRDLLTMHFTSPCAFSMGNRKFAMFPEPLLLWESLERTWNRYAPEVLHMDKLTLREYIAQNVLVSDYELRTGKATFSTHIQKGFLGICTYQIKTKQEAAVQLASLAEFARFAGVGSKTTNGMGQARVELLPDQHQEA